MPHEMSQREQEYLKVLSRLDKAGVPRDLRWRTLILYMRNVKGFYFLTQDQKAGLQKLIAECVNCKDYSDARYEEVVKLHEEVLFGPLRQKYEAAVEETEALLRDFHDLLTRKKGDVQDLAVVSVNAVKSGKSPKEMISTMRKAFHEVVHSMQQDMDNLARMSTIDDLTQLYNRRALDAHLDHCLTRACDNGHCVSLIMLDIDHFKRFNDTYGHRVGDQALRTVAKVLRIYGEELNRGEEDGPYYPARYGGEEFAVVLDGLDRKECLTAAEEIRRRLERYHFTIQDKHGRVLHEGIRITASLGAAQLDPEWKGALAGNLIEAADRNLYKAKEAGRNRVEG